MNKEELQKILESHKEWLEDNEKGQRADLRQADLRWADLDFSTWPIWCGGLNVTIDKKIAVQLAYHLCSCSCDDKEFQEIRSKLLDFANQFHRIKECGILK